MKTLKELGFKKDACTHKTCFSNGGDEIIIHNDRACFIELEKPTKEIFDAILIEVEIVEKREKIKLNITEEVKQLIRLLPLEIKWATRDKDGEPFGFETKPTKETCSWMVANGKVYSLRAFEHILSTCITWNDTEPTSLDMLRALL